MSHIYDCFHYILCICMMAITIVRMFNANKIICICICIVYIKLTKLYFKHENAVQEKHILYLLPFKPQHDNTNKMTCATGEDSDQAGHPHSMIRAFAVRMKNTCVLDYPMSAQQAKALIRLGGCPC